MSAQIIDLIRTAIREDGWPWDWTTIGTLKKPEQQIHARVVVKAPGVWSGDKVLRSLPLLAQELATGTQLGRLTVRSNLRDGAKVRPGQVVCEWRGPARLVLALERPFLNLTSYLCGISTQTRLVCDAVTRACPRRTPRVTPTRKTLPGYRDLALHAVQIGGGFCHRVSLSGGVLIKENHIAAAGGVRAAILGARAVAPHGLKIEVEVRKLNELDQALGAGAEVIMLDNFSPAQVRAALTRVEGALAKVSGRARPVIEVSGGLTLSNIGDFAIPGVDVLSLGSLTHSVEGLDLSLLCKAK